MTDTGQIVRMLRKSKGWTIAELAFRSGLSPNTISNVERGSNCTILVFDSLVEAMGYELEILKRDEYEEESEDEWV